MSHKEKEKPFVWTGTYVLNNRPNGFLFLFCGHREGKLSLAGIKLEHFSKEKMNRARMLAAKERLTVVSTCLGAFLRTSRCWRPNNVPTVNDDRDSLSCHSSGHQDRVLTCHQRKEKEKKKLIKFHQKLLFLFLFLNSLDMKLDLIIF